MDRSLVVAALSVLWLALPARAETLPNWSMRELMAQSENVVDAAPVDPPVPARFRALRVLLGTALKEGDVFDVDDLSAGVVTWPTGEGESGRKTARITEALLFMGPKKAAAQAARFSLTMSGLRVRRANGDVLYARQQRNPGGYVLSPYRAPVAWDDLVRKAAADAVEVSHVRFLKGIGDPHRRNQALLDWVESRRREFGGGLALMGDDVEPSLGWGSLEQDVFKWIFESCIPADCWAAATLYAELNRGENPSLERPAFGTRTGRAMLLAVALDDAALAGNRARALDLLVAASTLWSPKSDAYPDVRPLDAEEQVVLIDRLTPLLKNADPGVRGSAVKAILEASFPLGGDLKPLHTRRALPALTAAYKDQSPGPGRNTLARAVRVVGDPKSWEELTGNAHGVVAVLQDPGCEHGAEAFCWLVAWQNEQAIPDKPTLVLERLDDKLKVVEKKEMPLNGEPAIRAGGRSEGDMEDFHYFTFSMAGCTPGAWRMTVKGTAGKDKGPWASEPRLLQLTPPPAPNQPNADLTRPRIYFDDAAPPKSAVAPPGGPVEKATIDILK